MNKNDFPIFKKYPNLVYLDNSATTQKPNVVLDRILKYYKSENSNVHRGIHELAEKATLEYENAREIVAKFLNVTNEEVVFTSGTTEGINLLAFGFEDYFEDVKGKTILLTEMEHHSNILPWQRLAEKLDWNLEFIKLTDEFRLDLEDLKIKLLNDVAIFSYIHASNVLGTINPLDEINKLVRKKSPEAIIVVDGAQYVPHHKVDLSKNFAPDFYVFSGHKMMAPTGIGVLYGKKEWLEKLTPAKRGGGMINKVERETANFTDLPEKFEAGTPNISGAIALGEALKYLEKVNSETEELTEYFLQNAKTVTEMNVFGPMNTKERLPVFSFTLDNIHAHDVAQLLDQEGIAVRAGHHCTQILHREVLRVPATVRASLYFYNEKQDIDKLFQGINKVTSKFKQ